MENKILPFGTLDQVDATGISPEIGHCGFSLAIRFVNRGKGKPFDRMRTGLRIVQGLLTFSRRISGSKASDYHVLKEIRHCIPDHGNSFRSANRSHSYWWNSLSLCRQHFSCEWAGISSRSSYFRWRTNTLVLKLETFWIYLVDYLPVVVAHHSATHLRTWNIKLTVAQRPPPVFNYIIIYY